MPQITKTALAFALAMLALLGVLSLAGCGDSSSGSNYDSDAGKHPDGWLPFGHAGPARENFDSCRPCHGQDFGGGISKVACTQCHLDDPSSSLQPVHDRVHGPFGYALHADYVQQNGATSCANFWCHGLNLQGGPGTGLQGGGSWIGSDLQGDGHVPVIIFQGDRPAPACTSCHLGGPLSAHPVEWTNQITLHGGYVLQNGTAGCRNSTCHGTNLQGIFLSGPACNDCHNFTTPIPDIPAKLVPRSLAELADKYAAWLLRKGD